MGMMGCPSQQSWSPGRFPKELLSSWGNIAQCPLRSSNTDIIVVIVIIIKIIIISIIINICTLISFLFYNFVFIFIIAYYLLALLLPLLSSSSLTFQH